MKQLRDQKWVDVPDIDPERWVWVGGNGYPTPEDYEELFTRGRDTLKLHVLVQKRRREEGPFIVLLTECDEPISILGASSDVDLLGVLSRVTPVVRDLLVLGLLDDIGLSLGRVGGYLDENIARILHSAAPDAEDFELEAMNRDARLKREHAAFIAKQRAKAQGGAA